MKKLVLVGASILLFTNAASAKSEDCKSLAKKAALAIGAVINENSIDFVEVREIANDSKAQVFTVLFDTEERGASVTYTVTVERNPSPIERNQTCLRVSKVELSGEE